MLTSTVIDYYGGVRAAGRALGINHSAIVRWGDVVPYPRACIIEHETRGKLRVDESLYDEGEEVAA